MCLSHARRQRRVYCYLSPYRGFQTLYDVLLVCAEAMLEDDAGLTAVFPLPAASKASRF